MNTRIYIGREKREKYRNTDTAGTDMEGNGPVMESQQWGRRCVAMAGDTFRYSAAAFYS